MPDRFKYYLKSPIGFVEISSTNEFVSELYFRDETGNNSENLPGVLLRAIKQVKEYFEGRRQEFDLPLAPEGTEFQQKVWKQLLKIPFGITKSYLDIATEMGDRKALRAVGNANGKNKISIIIPCHRVIGASGNLTGFGGGIWRKKWLLDHENKFIQGSLF